MNDTTSRPLHERLFKANFPRSSKYDPHWLMDNAMGPNVLWLVEWLAERLHLTPGMRVLDLGCGRAISSIFLAQQFGVTVWAADYWVKATENFERIEQSGCSTSVYPISVEGHSLPFAEGSFDAIVSFDAYNYFGTDDLYLGYIYKFLKPGGCLGVVSPGTLEELSDGPSPHIAPYWVWDFCSFHCPEWWRRHWQKTGLVDLEMADTLIDGWKLWLEWNEICEQFGPQGRASLARREADMLRVDDGRTFGFIRLIARRRR